jgi:hypothetical protein
MFVNNNELYRSTYPIFNIIFFNDYLVVGGGGGTSKSGVKNMI